MWASSMVCNMQLNVYIDDLEEYIRAQTMHLLVMINFRSFHIHTHTLHAHIHISLIYILRFVCTTTTSCRDTASLLLSTNPLVGCLIPFVMWPFPNFPWRSHITTVQAVVAITVKIEKMAKQNRTEHLRSDHTSKELTKHKGYTYRNLRMVTSKLKNPNWSRKIKKYAIAIIMSLGPTCLVRKQ